MRRTTLGAVCLLLLTLTGCGSDPEPKHAKAPPSAPTHTISASPTPSDPVPPAMPAAAKKHTIAGAKAFIRYFWRVAGYSQKTLDAAPLRPLLSAGCQACQGALGFVEDVAKDHGTVHGGATTVSDLQTTRLRAGKVLLIRVKYKLTSTRQVVDYRGKKKSEVYTAGTDNLQFELLQSRPGWTIISWTVIP